MTESMRNLLLTTALTIGTLGCGSEPPPDGPSCDAALPDVQCSPLYEPTFNKLHERLFEKKCALAGGACHAATGAQGGLVLEGDADEVYAILTSDDMWLAPQALGCGSIYDRLHRQPGDSKLMPPGAPLQASELCALNQWLTAGAPR